MTDAPLEQDPLLLSAAQFAIRRGRVNVADLRGKFPIGAPRARVLLQQLEDNAIVGPDDGRRHREALLAVRDLPAVRRQLGGPR
ncbi:DNA translocase FtsK [Nocardioides marmoraquaticus]